MTTTINTYKELKDEVANKKVLANQATDLVINAKLQQLGYPTIKLSKTIRELGLAFKAGDVEKYSMLSEETVARKLISEEIKSKENKKKQKGKDQSGGQGQSGGGNQEGGQGESGGDQEWSDNTIPLEDLIKILEENGLTNLLDALQLPSSDNLDEITKIEENTLLKDIENIEKAAAQKSALSFVEKINTIRSQNVKPTSGYKPT